MLHVTVCVSFDPTVSEACDQNQNENQNSDLEKKVVSVSGHFLGWW